MRETGEREGTAERFTPSLLMSQKKMIPCTRASPSLYSAQNEENYKKHLKYPLYIKGKLGRNQKEEQKFRKSKSSMNSGMKGEQCVRGNFTTCEILQVAKFLQSCKIATVTQFLCIFCASFLLVSDLKC